MTARPSGGAPAASLDHANDVTGVPDVTDVPAIAHRRRTLTAQPPPPSAAPIEAIPAVPAPAQDAPAQDAPATAPADRPAADWDNFGPPPPLPPHPPTRLAAHTARARRFLTHEWTLAVLGGLGLSVLINHGSLPGHDPLALVGSGPAVAMLRDTVTVILAQALSAIGAYALVRQLGAVATAAAVAAMAVAVAPWRLGQAGNLAMVSQLACIGGVVLALAMLARGHGVRWRGHGARPLPRPGWALAGWLVAAWPLVLGIGVGSVFLYVLLGLVLAGLARWLVEPAGAARRARTRLLVADAAGGLLLVGLAIWLARPHRLDFASAADTDDWIARHSPTLRGFFTAPEASLLWGGTHAPARALLSLPEEMALLPGFTLYALATAGLLFSVWPVRIRLALLAGVVASIAVGLGTHGPAEGRAGYLLLTHHLPGFGGPLVPGQLIIWTTLLLALLAAGWVAALVARAGEVALRRGLPRPTAVARLALLLPVALVLAEGAASTSTPRIPAPPAPIALSSTTLSSAPAEYLAPQGSRSWIPDHH